MASCSSISTTCNIQIILWVLTILICPVMMLGGGARAAGTANESIDNIDVIQDGLAAFVRLRNELHLSPSPLYLATIESFEEKSKRVGILSQTQQTGTGQSLITAICTIITPETLIPGPACLKEIENLNGLTTRLNQQQRTLQVAADLATSLHDQAYKKFLASLFEHVVCRRDSEICGEDSEKTREWWQESGQRALMVLDRIGREHIKLSEKLSDEAIENARDHVFARLVNVLNREDVKLVVRALETTDSARFTPLLDAAADRTKALKSVSAISGWIKDTIALEFESLLESAPSETDGLSYLITALGRIKKDVSQLDSIDPVEALVAGFQESRQRLVEIVIAGNAMNKDKSCSLPDPALAMGPEQSPPSPTLNAIATAVHGLMSFVEACKRSTEQNIDGLAAAILVAKPSEPTPVAFARALCRFNATLGNVIALRKLFIKDLPANAKATVQLAAMKQSCDVILQLPDRLEAAQEILDLMRSRVIDQAQATGIDADTNALDTAQELLLSVDMTARVAIGKRLNIVDKEIWAISRLLMDDGMLDFEVVKALGTCAAPEGPLALGWHFVSPRLDEAEDGLELSLSADISLCKPMELRLPVEAYEAGITKISSKNTEPVQATWKFARAKGAVSIKLSDLFPTGNNLDRSAVEKAIVELRKRVTDSAKIDLEIDEDSFRRLAVVELKDQADPVSEAAIEELLSTRFTDAVRRIVPEPGLRHWLKLSKDRYKIVANGSLLEVRTSLEIEAIGFEVGICIAVPLHDGAGITSDKSKSCLDVRKMDTNWWIPIEKKLQDSVLAQLRKETEGRLGPYTNILDERLTELSAQTNGVSLVIDLTYAQLVMKFPDVLEGGGALPSPLINNDFAGELQLTLDLSNGAVEVSALPRLDLDALVRRIYPAFANEAIPILLLQTVEQSSSACNEAPGIKLSFGPELAIEGTLGSLCWRNEQLEFAAPNDGNFGRFALDLPTAGLRISIDSGGAELGLRSPTVLRLVGTLEAVGKHDPWGLRDSIAGHGIVLDIDLAGNTVAISADESGNTALYAHIRAHAQSWLPTGSSITLIEISDTGIDLQVSGLEGALYNSAFDSFFSSDNVQAMVKSLTEQELRPDACLAIRASAVSQMLRRMAVPEKKAQTALSRCPYGIVSTNSQTTRSVKASNALYLAQQDHPVLQWECEDGPNATLNSCLLQLPQFREYCGNLQIQLSRGTNFDANGQPTVRSIGSQNCLEKQLKALIPSKLEQFRLQQPDELTLDCPDGAGLTNCAIIALVPLSFEAMADQLSDLPGDHSCGELSAASLDATLRIGIDGSVRPGSNLRNKLAKLSENINGHLLCRLTGVAGEAAAEAAVDIIAWLNTLRQNLAAAQQEGTQWASFTCRAIFTRTIDGSESVPCEVYGSETLPPALLSQPPSAIVFTRTITIFDTGVQINATLPVFEGQLGPPALRLDCTGCDSRLVALADTIAKTMISKAGEALIYKESSASLTIADQTIRFSAPFILKIEELGISSTLSVVCLFRVFDDSSLNCGGTTLESQSLIGSAISKHLGDRLTRENMVVPMGPLEGRVSGATHEGSSVFLSGTMAVLGMKPPIAMNITLPLFGNAFRVEFDEKELSDNVGKHIAEQLNALFGDAVPLTISKVVPVRSEDGSGKLDGIRISSSASIEGLFTISVPDVLLTENGLKIDGPSELAIAFPPNLQIPAPPVTICPTGGTLGAERLVILASITTLECTADSMLSIKGRAEISFRNPGVFKLRGDMVLLGFLTLGNSNAELNIHEHYFDSVLDIGGPISDIVSYRSEMRVEGGRNNPHAQTRDKLSLFRVPVSDQNVYVDFKKGAVDAELSINLFGVITGNGSFGMDSFGGNPHSNIKGSAQIGGLTLGDLEVRAKPNIARARFNVLGLKLTVVVPGLDSLTPGYLADIVKNLLTPDFENLDEALIALLSGKVTINPIAKFGKGGNSALDGSDGEKGEPSTGVEGLGEGADESAPVPPETPDADKKVESESSSAGRPSKLNPPGQFHIELSAGDPVHSVKLMEGPRFDTDIAAVPEHSLINPVFSHQAGVGLFFTESSYIHLADVQVKNAADVSTCSSGQIEPAVFTFMGVEEPKVGYFELCRMRIQEDGQSIRAIKQEELTDANYAELVRPFLTALSAFPGTMPDLMEEGISDNGAPERILLTGYLGKVSAGPAGEVRAVVGMPRPGRLLVVTDLPGAADENTPCTATPQAFGERQIRAFVLDVPKLVRPLDKEELELLGNSIAGIAACSSGTVAVYENETSGRQYISADGNLSGWDENTQRFRLIRKRDSDPEREEVIVPPDPMLAAIEPDTVDDTSTEVIVLPPIPTPEELEAKTVEVLEIEDNEETSRQNIPILTGVVAGVSLQLVEDESSCIAQWSDGRRITGYSPEEIGGKCQPEHVLAVASAMETQDSDDPEHLLLLKLKPDGSASHLIHLGWGAGERITFEQQWQRSSALAAFESLERFLQADQPLQLRKPIGFETPIDGSLENPVALTFEGRDGSLRLVWGSSTGRGALVLPKNLETERITALPLLMSGLVTDKALPPPHSFRNARTLNESTDRLILSDIESSPSRIQPVITWLTNDDRWHLSARVIETPPATDSTRVISAALLDEHLNSQNPTDPVSDVWLFRLTPSQIGYAFKSPSGHDEIYWRENEWSPGAALEGLVNAVEKHLSHNGTSALYELCYIADQVTGLEYAGATKILEFIDKKRQNFQDYSALSPETWRQLYITGVLKLHMRTSKTNSCKGLDSKANHSPPVDSTKYSKTLETKLSIRLDANPEVLDAPVALDMKTFSTYRAKIAGFHALHAPDACHKVARALLSRSINGSIENLRLWRSDQSCELGTVLLLEGTESTVKAIHEQRDGGFKHSVEIKGDALPERLLIPFRKAFPNIDKDVVTRLTGQLVPLTGRDPAWAAQDDTGALRIIMTQGGDPKVIEIEGLSIGDTSLDSLISFAIDSNGERFEYLQISDADKVLLVENKANEHRLFLLGANFEPIAWVALDSDEPIEGKILESLALMLNASWVAETSSNKMEVKEEIFAYSTNKNPPVWTVSSSATPAETRVGIRPFKDGPYFLLTRDNIEPLPDITILCAPRLPSIMLLDLAERTREDFAQRVADTNAVAEWLEKTAGKSCDEGHPGIVSFTPASARGLTGLVHGVDAEARMIVAGYSLCKNSGTCALNAERTGPGLPLEMRKGLLAILRSSLMREDGTSSNLHVLYDSALADSPSTQRRLVLGWSTSDIKDVPELGARLLYADNDPLPGMNFSTCLTPPIPVRFNTGQMETLETIDPEYLEKYSEKLSGYLSQRLGERLLTRSDRRDIDEFATCASLGDLRPFVLIEDDGMVIFEEERAASLQRIDSILTPSTGVQNR